MKIIDIENSFVEELRCGICNDYLICFPIRVCTDGQIICGKCEPEDNSVNMFSVPYRVPLLEYILKKTKFSCKFKEVGCDEELSMDFIKDHELKCVYRTSGCIFKDCEWMEQLVKLESHCFSEHFDDYYINSLQISTCWADNFDYTTKLSLVDDIPVIIEYKYSKDTVVLSYKISYVSAHIEEACYTIYKFNRKLAEGQVFSYEPLVPVTDIIYEELDMKDYLNSVFRIVIIFTKYPWSIVDYASSKIFLCSKCDEYSLPFPYDLQSFGFICGACAATNQHIVASTHSSIKMIQNVNFPCKWSFCNFVSTPNRMYEHEKTCWFRKYKCPLKDNCGFGDLDYVKKHLIEVHEYYYFNRKLEMKKNPVYKNTLYQRFTVRYGTFIILNATCSKNGIQVKLTNFGGLKNVPVYVVFKHDHCSAVSKRFCVVNECHFTLDDLPDCFKKETQKYTATVTVD